MYNTGKLVNAVTTVVLQNFDLISTVSLSVYQLASYPTIDQSDPYTDCAQHETKTPRVHSRLHYRAYDVRLDICRDIQLCLPSQLLAIHSLLHRCLTSAARQPVGRKEIIW